MVRAPTYAELIGRFRAGVGPHIDRIRIRTNSHSVRRPNPISVIAAREHAPVQKRCAITTRNESEDRTSAVRPPDLVMLGPIDRIPRKLDREGVFERNGRERFGPFQVARSSGGCFSRGGTSLVHAGMLPGAAAEDEDEAEGEEERLCSLHSLPGISMLTIQADRSLLPASAGT